LRKFDYLIVGAGVIGLAIAKELKSRYVDSKILIIEKEREIAFHASGRNSGVLHAGFYYTANSLKAKFTRDGNRALKKYCYEKNLKINESKKVVVAQNESELESLFELKKRGDANSVETTIIDEEELSKIEPNAKTFQKALYSPSTATVDPIEVCNSIKNDLIELGVEFSFEDKYLERVDTNSIKSSKNIYHFDRLINCSGVYADKIAKDFNFSKDYTMLPFKGLYLKYSGEDRPVKTNIYPVPNLKNPFLGVHYTITVDGSIKIGPTAIPALWRENYSGFDRFDCKELVNILSTEANLFIKNRFNFRDLAFEEMKKYSRKYLASLAKAQVKEIDESRFNISIHPGIRAQLLNIKTLELVQDFVVEGDDVSTHVLNSVSPAFTSSFPFAKYVLDNFIK